MTSSRKSPQGAEPARETSDGPRRGPGAPALADLNQAIRGALEVVTSELGIENQVQLDLAESPMAVRLDRDRLQGMIVELVRTAWQGRHGGLRIASGTTELEVACGPLAPGNHVYVWAGSDVSDSADVTLLLPSETSQPPAATADGQRILLVDDEGLVLELTHEVLERAGYRVRAVASAAGALELDAAAFDVLVTDVLMPGMTGDQLALRLLERNPALRIVFMSGYFEGLDLEGLTGELDAVFIEKPFRPHQLIATVAGALRSPPGNGGRG